MHPDWMQAAWPGLTEPQRTSLLACGRVQYRLRGLVAKRLGWPDGPVGAGPLAGLAALPASHVHMVALLAGAAWHAGSVRLVMAAAEVEALVRIIGARARGFALAYAGAPATAAERVSAAALAARIDAAAQTSLAAWLAALPPGPRRLALPNFPRIVAEAAVAACDAETALRLMTAAALQDG